MTDTLAEPFLSYAREKLVGEYWPRTCASVNTLSEEQIWWRPNESSNSIGNLLLHLRGNVQQWIVSAIGGESLPRDRDAEFEARGNADFSALRAALDDTLGKVDAILQRLTADDLARRHAIQGYDVTALQAIFHVVEHFGMHHGQILYIAKMLQDRDLGFYAHLSGPGR